MFTEVAWADATSINSASHDHTSWVRENETQRGRHTDRDGEETKEEIGISTDMKDQDRDRHRDMSHSKAGKIM